MGGLLDVLSQGGAALQVHALGAQIAGNNVANAQAPGYHREEAVITAGAARGRGTFARLDRCAIASLDVAVSAQAGDSAYADVRAQALASLEGAVASLDDDALGASLNAFFNGWRDLANHPSDNAVRTAALGDTEALAARVRQSASQLVRARTDADQVLVATIPGINNDLVEVARLNAALTATEGTGSVSADLRDQRDLILEGLAQSIGATRFTGASGELVVSIGGGLQVVAGDHVQPLVLTIDPVDGTHHITIEDTTLGTIDSRIGSGVIGGLLAVRDTDIPAQQAALDTFATDLTTAVNAVHAAGYGTDGVTGRNLFTTSPATAAALALTVDATVSGQGAHLAAAGGTSGPGDNVAANALTALQSAAIASGNTVTLAGALSQAVSRFGQEIASAEAAQSVATARLGQARKLAEGQEGVSIEDQMVQLSRFQNGFQAAARVITTIDQMLNSLMAM